VELRPLAPDDVPAALAVQETAFRALGDGRQPWEPGRRARGAARMAHLIATDPGGAWGAWADRELVGVALALVREGVWGLSLLVVAPGHQSHGAGRALLARALAHGAGARGGLIVSSRDPRAMRAYARAGFALRPNVAAHGVVDPAGLPRPAGVRPGDERDLALADAVGREVRGGGHGPDLPELLRWSELLVAPGRGFAFHRDGSPVLLAALDERAARDLLAAVLRAAPPGAEVGVEQIGAGQDWAVEVALDAGLALSPWGPTFVRGALGPLAPYLPSGAYL
jgi:GNAT superfamily N-acetyltransferase